MKWLSLVLACALSACSTGGEELAAALIKAKADACGAAQTSFPPFNAVATICVTGAQAGSSVTVGKDGTMTLQRGSSLLNEAILPR